MTSSEEIVNLPVNTSRGVLRKVVWKLAWPSMAEFSLLMAVGLSDVFLMGHLSPETQQKLGYDSASALAGTSAGQFFNWFIITLLASIGLATTTLVARSIGAKERSRGIIFARQALLLGFLTGVLVIAVALLFGRSFLFMLGAEGNLVELGFIYIATTAIGMPMHGLLVSGNGSLRGSGDTRTPLLIMICVNLVNIGVGWILINGNFGFPALGIRGAGIGAASGWTVGAVMVLTRLLGLWPGAKSESTLRVNFTLRLQLPFVKELFQIGLPTLGEQLVFQIGLFFFARFIVSLGTTVYAGYSAIITIDSASFLPGMGLATAASILVGQSLGANRPDLAERYAKTAWLMGAALMGTLGLFFIGFPELFLSFLVENKAVVAEASGPLRIAGAFDAVQATCLILIGALRGAGDTTWPLYSRLLGTWGLRICLSFLFIQILGLGLVGGRIAMGMDGVAVAIFIYFRFRSGRWKEVWANKTKSARVKAKSASGQVVLASSAPAPLENEV